MFNSENLMSLKQNLQSCANDVRMRLLKMVALGFSCFILIWRYFCERKTSKRKSDVDDDKECIGA